MKMDDIIDRIPELSDEIKSDYMKVGGAIRGLLSALCSSNCT